MSRAAVYEALLAAERFIDRDRKETIDNCTVGGRKALKGKLLGPEAAHYTRPHNRVLRKIRKAMDAL